MTSMPDEVGAFLQATETISANAGNITRVSYNRTVDSHLLFIEVEACQERLDRITVQLEDIGYLSDVTVDKHPLLISIHLPDEPGALLPVLKAIDRYRLSISYMSSESDGSGWQDYQLAVIVEDGEASSRLLEEISSLCPVSVVDYASTGKLLDNTVFYLSFAQDMRNLLGLDQEQTNEFIINSNMIMQMLDERDETPFKTFDYIRRFANTVMKYKGHGFEAHIDRRELDGERTLYLIEPPCGSNIFVIDDGTELAFFDGGFPCYREEISEVLRSLFVDFDLRRKTMLLTHADVDHVGLAPLCDEIQANESCYENFALEGRGERNFREQNRKDAPYVRLSKIIAGYDTPLEADAITVYGGKSDDALISSTGEVDVLGVRFRCFEGAGGHVRGESIYLCDEFKLAFTGDLIVNITGFSDEQAEFNRYAPYLMSSVNADSAKAREIRLQLEEGLDGYLVCPGHGRWFEEPGKPSSSQTMLAR